MQVWFYAINDVYFGLHPQRRQNSLRLVFLSFLMIWFFIFFNFPLYLNTSFNGVAEHCFTTEKTVIGITAAPLQNPHATLSVLEGRGSPWWWWWVMQHASVLGDEKKLALLYLIFPVLLAYLNLFFCGFSNTISW